MISHKTRVIVAVIFAVLAIVALSAQRWLQLDEITQSWLRGIFSWATTAIAIAAAGDALAVERRRRDPSVPALPDDKCDRAEVPTARD